MTAPTPSDDLQFSTAEPSAPLTPHSDAGTAAACAECGQPIARYYFTVGGRTMCASCKVKVERALAGEGTSRAGRISKSLALGFGAAIVGAAIWFGIAAMFDLEIGLVAILIGFMVGRAVQMGSGGRGGRRYQVAAALLTYLSIAMSYGALGIRQLVEEKNKPVATATAGGAKAGLPAVAPDSNVEAVAMDGSIVPATATGATAGDSTSATPSGGAFAAAVAFMLGFMFVLPIIANLSSMPGGILGLAIMAFGIHQAWTMNARVEVPITGPHRIGDAGDATAA